MPQYISGGICPIATIAAALPEDRVAAIATKLATAVNGTAGDATD